MAFDTLKARQAQAYSSAPFEQLADSAADIHDHLVDALGVSPGERWLDLATGTGAVAFRAVRRGAQVTGQDLASGLITTARRLASQQGVTVRFEVGDCEALPYPDASFDVLSSAQGAVFAPDHAAVAAELARVSRPGGRIGLTAWRPGGAIAAYFQLQARFQAAPPPRSPATRWTGVGPATSRRCSAAPSTWTSPKPNHPSWPGHPRRCGTSSAPPSGPSNP